MPMGQKDKLIQQLKSKPKDFPFDEAESLLHFYSYSRSNKGKTSGSRVAFVSDSHHPFTCTNHIHAGSCLTIR